MGRGCLVKLHDRLTQLSGEIAEAQTALRILEEQLAFLEEVADDARIRAVVSETPLADREFREAQGDLERMRRSHADAASRVEELRREQDLLLERIFEDGGGR
jgi:predicted RNase H-like nuclease (RuvC/YqgF family)